MLMELHLKIALLCISWVFWFQFISCEKSLNHLGTLEWTCMCAGGPLGAPNHTAAFICSASCACIPGSADGVWNCSCASEGSSQTPGNIHNASCFTACNCTSGTSIASKRHLSHKGVVVLLCVVLSVIAFFASIACYFYRKDRPSLPSPAFSSGKHISWNSMTNLINHRSAAFPQCQAKSNTGSNGFTGFIHRLFWVFGSERGTFPGAILQFSYAELEKATNKFSNANLIGVGGSSNVFRGFLKDGRVVAVKRLRSLGGPDLDSELLSEIELLSRLNHCHVVPLLGYCLESQGKQPERLLVVEYMSNGNLRDCLDAKQGKEPLDWDTRVQIAMGAARGLEYLHEAAAPRILHRDIKSTNILLDEKYSAKITDLGMAKCLMVDDLTSCSSSPARMLGTFGYFAPEYAIVGKASLKSDVFSFGVVILELITGRQPIHRTSNKGNESLVIWAKSRLCDSKLVVSELPDPLLKGKFPEEEMQIMAHLARECLQWDPESRPTMSEVVQILSAITPVKSNRRNIPASFFTSSTPHNIKSTTDVERSEGPNGRRHEPNRAVSERRQARCSLPIAIDRNLCEAEEERQKNTETALSVEHMERLLLLTSNVRRWRSVDEEMVDLTEPRFESFMQANVQSTF